MAIQCEMIIGYLVPHRCENQAISPCVKCGRSVCELHVDITKGGLICTACQQGLDHPVLLAETARTFDDSDMRVFSQELFDDADDGELFADLS